MRSPRQGTELVRGIWRGLATTLGLGIALAGVVLGQPAPAHTFTVLYRFTGGADGGNPEARLVRDAAGNLYGTTIYDGAFGYGTVFMLDTTGKLTVLYTFTSSGEEALGGLIRDTQGNLYGATPYGGISNCVIGAYTYQCGGVFKVSKAGKKTDLYLFPGGSAGGQPYDTGGLVRDSKGNLYGTATFDGGGGGMVFKLDNKRHATILYRFQGGTDGADPFGGLVRDTKGNLYGTTAQQGNLSCQGWSSASGCGTVFVLSTTGEEKVLHTFGGSAKRDGANPVASLAIDAAGNLYGTTWYGGINKSCDGNGTGCGTVFKVAKTGKMSVLYRFKGQSDGANPFAGLVLDAAGNLYGATLGGGSSGNGVIFKLSKSGKETVLHSFTGGADGAYPAGGPILDSSGNLYGVAFYGGTEDWGTIFKLTP